MSKFPNPEPTAPKPPPPPGPPPRARTYTLPVADVDRLLEACRATLTLFEIGPGALLATAYRRLLRAVEALDDAEHGQPERETITAGGDCIAYAQMQPDGTGNVRVIQVGKPTLSVVGVDVVPAGTGKPHAQTGNVTYGPRSQQDGF